MNAAGRQSWWRGARGEWYVVAQVALMVFVFFGPRGPSFIPPGSDRLALGFRLIGIAMLAAGFTLLLAGLLQLGRHLTPLPYPVDDGILLQSGAFGVVRHPMYGGGIALAAGWVFVVHGWLTLLYVVVLTVFLDIKASREERWLVEAYPDYPTYQRRVRKLIPFIR